VPFPFPEASSGGAAQTARPLVLIVDDNEKNLKLARDVLRASDLGTLEATSGSEALALAFKHRPDVILLDVRLPDVDGTMVAQQLKNDPRTASIPVVALTSLTASGDGDWFSNAGFDGSLQKPITVTEFPRQVLAYCR
jgi:two-component system cell cycle response regulator DivK